MLSRHPRDSLRHCYLFSVLLGIEPRALFVLSTFFTPDVHTHPAPCHGTLGGFLICFLGGIARQELCVSVCQPGAQQECISEMVLYTPRALGILSCLPKELSHEEVGQPMDEDGRMSGSEFPSSMEL